MVRGGSSSRGSTSSHGEGSSRSRRDKCTRATMSEAFPKETVQQHPSRSDRSVVRNFLGKHILTGKQVLLNELHHLDIANIIEVQGWGDFMTLSEPVYKSLVIEFYENLHWNSYYGEVESRVGNTAFTITKEYLCAIFNIPNNSGRSHLIFAYDELPSGIEYEGLVEYFNQDLPNPSTKLPPLHLLSTRHRILAKLLMLNVLPRHSKDDDFYRPVAIAIERFDRGQKVNMPVTILSYMQHAVNTCRALPYGMALTRIFRAKGVDLSRSKGTPFRYDWDFGLATLKRMGYYYWRGHWLNHTEFSVLDAADQATIKRRIKNKSTFNYEGDNVDDMNVILDGGVPDIEEGQNIDAHNEDEDFEPAEDRDYRENRFKFSQEVDSRFQNLQDEVHHLRSDVTHLQQRFDGFYDEYRRDQEEYHRDQEANRQMMYQLFNHLKIP